MRKTIIILSTTLFVGGAVVFATNYLQSENCSTAEFAACPCTPDCQPGDSWCSCPVGCDN